MLSMTWPALDIQHSQVRVDLAHVSSCKVVKDVVLVVIIWDKEAEQLADKQRSKQQGRQGTSQSRSESLADKQASVKRR